MRKVDFIRFVWIALNTQNVEQVNLKQEKKGEQLYQSI